MNVPYSPIASFADETKAIGDMLIAYGELEFDLLDCVSRCLGDLDTAVRLLFRARGELQRIEVADAIIRPKYDGLSLIDAYTKAYDAMNWCRRLRNQYAHCHWAVPESGKLKFVSLEEGAKLQSGNIMLAQKKVDLALLNKQRAYFRYSQELFWYLNYEHGLAIGITGERVRSKPASVAKPALHYGPAKRKRSPKKPAAKKK